MSSAILYLAIIAIWACVLIPRWLKRDSARAAIAVTPGDSGTPETVVTDDVDDADDGAEADPVGSDDEAAPRRGDITAHAPAPRPLSAAESRRRMLAGRRRLLIMLAVLELAAITLAASGLAAMWVVIPPTIMLAGYLLLLREASRADAERAAREAAAATRARARTRARASRPASVASDQPATVDAGAALAARFAAAPVPADHEDSAPGRDFAPGLAGKYTPSYASNSYDDADPGYEDRLATTADAEDEDSYEPPRLRAVGD